MDPGTVLSTGHHKETTCSIHHKILDQITEVTVTPTMKIHKIDKASTETTAEIEGTSNNQNTNREIKTTRTGMRTTKIEIGLTTGEDQTNTKYQHKTQVIFEFADQNMMEMMQTVRGFINLIKANCTTREHYKSNKLASRKYDNEVHESEIKSSSLDQVQQFFNKDTDLVFDPLVAADYINEIDCTDGVCQPST